MLCARPGNVQAPAFGIESCSSMFFVAGNLALLAITVGLLAFTLRLRKRD
jgi:hypothetical protein